ncbi:MAG: hypothetical protein ACRCWJ_06085 [Casimicrobium sp.]
MEYLRKAIGHLDSLGKTFGHSELQSTREENKLPPVLRSFIEVASIIVGFLFFFLIDIPWVAKANSEAKSFWSTFFNSPLQNWWFFVSLIYLVILFYSYRLVYYRRIAGLSKTFFHKHGSANIARGLARFVIRTALPLSTLALILFPLRAYWSGLLAFSFLCFAFVGPFLSYALKSYVPAGETDIELVKVAKMWAPLNGLYCIQAITMYCVLSLIFAMDRSLLKASAHLAFVSIHVVTLLHLFHSYTRTADKGYLDQLECETVRFNEQIATQATGVASK